MDDIVKEAANIFRIKLNNYSKLRAIFLLDTNRGAMILKRHNDTRKIETVFNTSEALRKAGFENVETFVTLNDKPYIYLKDGVYTLSTCGNGSRCSLTDTATLSAIAATLAKLHNTAIITDSHNLSASKTTAASYYSKKTAEARHIKKWLDKRSHFTDIDILFIKSFNHYLNAAETSAAEICEFLTETSLGLCFGAIKEDNIFIDDNGWVTLINLENCVLSAQLTDLCNLIRRSIKRGADCASVLEIINAYSSVRSLSERDIGFIKAFLFFPHKYFTLINRYYNGKKHYETNHTYTKLKAEAVHQSNIFEILNTI